MDEDLKRMGLRRCDAQDRTMWRNGVLGNGQPALALENGRKTDDDDDDVGLKNHKRAK